ncbi:sensor histidine kinase [Arcobacter sp. YIC-80]|uniref:sensor histidine kinase n=1 Tax=Arcobacter sp. YIC-80 TaxID=3376683 RepID=UPI003850E605
MIFKNIKFQYKIYIITFILIIFFILITYISNLNNKHIFENLENLKNTNSSLQSTLILLSDVEHLQRLIIEYTMSSDKGLIEPIEKYFNKVSNHSIPNISKNNNFSYIYKKLLDNIKQYKKNYEIAKKQIPLNFTLREDLRHNSKKLENELEQIYKFTEKKDSLIKVILIRKTSLEIERAVIRYLETDNRVHIKFIKNTFSIIENNFKMLEKSIKIDKKIINQISNTIKEFKKNVNQTIEHYRTYSMLTKVVMPGDVYEIYFYAEKLKTLTLTKIDSVQEMIKYYSELNKKFNFYGSIIYISLVILSFILIIRMLQKPLEELTIMFQKLSKGEDDVSIPSYTHDDNIGKLIQSADMYKQRNKETKELLKQTQDYKNNLEIKVENEINIRREQEKVLLHQAKLASMGEMIGAIAHQWRQPLNELSIRIQKIKYTYAKGKIDDEYIQEFIYKNKKTIDFMSKTIDDFRNFFRIDKEKIQFKVKKAIEDIIEIQTSQLKNYNIKVEILGQELVINGFKREFQQVIVNLLSNSKDSFISKQVKKPLIKIIIDKNKILFQDNAGGFSEDIIERVFEPYFTTKEQGEGTGIGLYMCKMIIEDNMNGKISASNKNDGAVIMIEFNKEEVKNAKS